VKSITVYAFDANLHTVVKIQKRGATWCVYRLKEVQVRRNRPFGQLAFIFEEHPLESWHYKPFEDKDVSDRPDIYYEDVKRWQPHLIMSN